MRAREGAMGGGDILGPLMRRHQFNQELLRLSGAEIEVWCNALDTRKRTPCPRRRREIQRMHDSTRHGRKPQSCTTQTHMRVAPRYTTQKDRNRRTAPPLSIEYGTHKTVTTRFWPSRGTMREIQFARKTAPDTVGNLKLSPNKRTHTRTAPLAGNPQNSIPCLFEIP